MGTTFDSVYYNSTFGCPLRNNAFDVRGIPANGVWELDYDFVNIWTAYMLTIGTSIYMAMSDGSVWKRASDGTYSRIKTGLSMASAIPCLGADGTTLIVDSQHQGIDSLYSLADDGTLTRETDSTKYNSQGYAGLWNNGAYLFWWRSSMLPAGLPNRNGAYRSSGSWTVPGFSAVTGGTAVFIDQRFLGAIPTIGHGYFTGDGNYLTQNNYGGAIGSPSSCQNMGVMGSTLYAVLGTYNTRDLWTLTDYASGWTKTATGLGGTLRGCYGYGDYVYISKYKYIYPSTWHRIYRYDGSSYVLDSDLVVPAGDWTGAVHRFVMCGKYVYCSAYGRVLRKKVA